MSSPAGELKIANSAEEWDKLLDSCPHATVFHLWDWLKIMEKHTNSKLYPLIGMKGSTPIGVFPLFYQKKYLLKFAFSPPPRIAIPYLGPLILDYHKLKQHKKESIFRDFQKQAHAFIFSNLKAGYARVQTAPGLIDGRPFKWTGYELTPLFDYKLDLTKGEEHIWKQFPKNLRQDILRAKRNGIQVEEGSRQDISAIYDGISERYSQQDRLVSFSVDYLLEVYDKFHPKNLRVFVARHNGKVIGGMIDTYYKDNVASWFGLSKAPLNANELLQWTGIKHAIEQDFKTYTEIGANTKRLCRFKSRYDSHLSQYLFLQYSEGISSLAKEIYSLFKAGSAKLQ